MLSRREIAWKASQAAAAKGRAKHKPGRASMITISPGPKPAVETDHSQTLTFLSELRLGLMTDAELASRFREGEARVRQLSRLAGPLVLNASGEIAQERVNLLSLQNEFQRRQLSRCQQTPGQESALTAH